VTDRERAEQRQGAESPRLRPQAAEQANKVSRTAEASQRLDGCDGGMARTFSCGPQPAACCVTSEVIQSQQSDAIKPHRMNPPMEPVRQPRVAELAGWAIGGLKPGHAFSSAQWLSHAPTLVASCTTENHSTLAHARLAVRSVRSSQRACAPITQALCRCPNLGRECAFMFLRWRAQAWLTLHSHGGNSDLCGALKDDLRRR